MDGPHAANYYLSMSCGPTAKNPMSDSTDLCTSCGLCCDGTLFDSTPFPRAEVGAVAALGLKPYEEPPGQPRFDQPCRHLKDTVCGVYEQRPSSCRAFRCQLLIALNEGQHTVSSAKTVVEEAKAMIDRVVPLMAAAGGPITPRQWRALLNRWRVDAREGRATDAEAKTVLELAVLNRFLDTHFRSSEQQVVKPIP